MVTDVIEVVESPEVIPTRYITYSSHAEPTIYLLTPALIAGTQ